MSTPYERFVQTTNQLVREYTEWCQDLYERIDGLLPDSPVTELEQLKHEVSACIEFGQLLQFQAHKEYNWLLIDDYLIDRCTQIREDQVKEGVDGVGSLRGVFHQFQVQKGI